MATKRRIEPWSVRRDRPVSCQEFAEAMYRVGQERREVRFRLRRMGRWTTATVATAIWRAECNLDLMFPHGNGHTARAWREAAERVVMQDVPAR